ncbi:hypothetical protein AB0G60_17005 [Streptomyces angustmyceticus]|uniref:DUF1877 domain-containing protein n=1 Tax=Streptomyces angustmyceticus TaxID=285578 RepID=A0A5J4LEF2_9ACTN|nr:hypothetical protein [Streptomyces angustmyceticus]UAL71017.1 hypothetical protein K7396_34465 [Streptomyces angustmyceticus]GES32543.1 hypothetical protein San01_50300 [Streptomyces angustmyceticus]
MSLLVHTFIRNADGDWDLTEDPPDGGHLAGGERWRTAVWGSESARALGARFLPRLASGDLYVEADEVAAFLEECMTLRNKSETFVAGLREPSDPALLVNVESKLDNFIAASRRALEAGGEGVLIW